MNKILKLLISFCIVLLTSNFALSKTTYKICVKIDGDHIGIEPNLKKIYNYLKTNPMENTVLYFSGFRIKNQQLFVLS